MIQKIKGYIKKEPVLCIALLLAFVSMFWIHPDAGYVDYIDFRTLAILFCLMAVVTGMKEIGVFDWFSQKLLLHVKGMWQVILILVLLCFFLSMAITNDVALITFVPLTIIVLGQLGEEKKRRWLLPVVVMQTVAANLGSMLTPIGNPQNLYLYGLADMGFAEFVRLMFPYSLAALFLLLVWIALSVLGKRETAPITIHLPKPARVTDVRRLLMHLALFLVCLLAVAHVLHYAVPLALVLLLMLVTDRKVLKQVDYSLLGTFVGFFVFIGNMGRLEAFRSILTTVIEGREMLTAVVASQVMSNVPAALLLSGFTDRYDLLLVGVNLGGLGTLIASMASLISFKYIAQEDKGLQGRYLIRFTAANLVFLAAMLAVHFLIYHIGRQ